MSCIMGPDLELKGRLNGMVCLNGKENGRALSKPTAKNMSCANNYQDNTFRLESSVHEQVNQFEKSEVNIKECTHQEPLNESAYQDETEYSSSFGNTASGDEDDDTLTDSEVISKPHDNGSGEECRMRKKRLTSHWKTFIQPHMWKCRLVELQIRRLLHQASKYDMQAEAISTRKQLASENLSVDDTGAKSLPISCFAQREKVMKRRKRKRVEDGTDKSADLAQHNLFSFFGSKKFGADVAPINDRANLGVPINVNSVSGLTEDPISLEFRKDDNSLEKILWKIGVLQSNIRELKTRVKKVQKENATDFFSADILKLFDASTSSVPNSAPINEGGKLVQSSSIASQLEPRGNSSDLLMHGSAISSHGEGTNLVDMIQCKDQLHIEKSHEKDGNGHLMHKDQSDKVEIEVTNTVEASEMEQVVPVPVIAIADNEPTPNRGSGNNKRKRGRGRRRGGRWNR